MLIGVVGGEGHTEIDVVNNKQNGGDDRMEGWREGGDRVCVAGTCHPITAAATLTLMRIASSHSLQYKIQSIGMHD